MNIRLAGLIIFTLVFSLVLQACGGGGNSDGGTKPEPQELSLNHAGYVSGTRSYMYGYKSISNIMITGQPPDLDWSRYAMLHDGTTYRLYFFKTGSNNTLYQFGYNPSTAMFEYGFNSIKTLTISGTPRDADPNSFSMLHDGSDYRLYMRSRSNPAHIYQFAYNTSTGQYQYGYRSIPRMDVTGAPADVDWERWGMLHDGSVYRHYAFKKDSDTTFYQFGFNRSVEDYQYGYNSIPVLNVLNMPSDSDTGNFAMLHDGTDYHFYFLVL